jgi:cardiolipin synthase
MTVFEKDLQGTRYDLGAMLGHSVSERVTVSPLSLQPILNFIRSAQYSISVQEQYLHEPEVNQALIDAAKSGKTVRVNVASACAFGRPTAKEAEGLRQTYQAFDAAGVKSRFFTDSQLIRGVPGYLHAKAIIVDDKRAWLGSINGSTTSFKNNREYGIFFDDPTSVSDLAAQMEIDFNDQNSESWQESIECLKDHPEKT